MPPGPSPALRPTWPRSVLAPRPLISATSAAGLCRAMAPAGSPSRGRPAPKQPLPEGAGRAGRPQEVPPPLPPPAPPAPAPARGLPCSSCLWSGRALRCARGRGPSLPPAGRPLGLQQPGAWEKSQATGKRRQGPRFKSRGAEGHPPPSLWSQPSEPAQSREQRSARKTAWFLGRGNTTDLGPWGQFSLSPPGV